MPRAGRRQTTAALAIYAAAAALVPLAIVGWLVAAGALEAWRDLVRDYLVPVYTSPQTGLALGELSTAGVGADRGGRDPVGHVDAGPSRAHRTPRGRDARRRLRRLSLRRPGQGLGLPSLSAGGIRGGSAVRGARGRARVATARRRRAARRMLPHRGRIARRPRHRRGADVFRLGEDHARPVCRRRISPGSRGPTISSRCSTRPRVACTRCWCSACVSRRGFCVTFRCSPHPMRRSRRATARGSSRGSTRGRRARWSCSRERGRAAVRSASGRFRRSPSDWRTDYAIAVRRQGYTIYARTRA